MIKNIKTTELKNIYGIIIDIRNTEKYNEGHIPNAINIPSEKLLMKPEKYLNKEQQYYIYCQKGISSQNISRILTVRGYKIINIIGGYENWKINAN